MILNNLKDTITAISTPLGTGGVGVVRISGKDSINIVSKLFSTSFKKITLPQFDANKIYHGWILDNNKPVDEVIVLIFKAPKSFTGEDVVEIQCHGGINVIQNILKLCINAGARLAEKGEFSKRAFLNGKMDLSKAEAVIDLIHSKTNKFAQVSAHNLTGKLASYIQEIRQEIIDLLSQINAALDFPEEVNEPEYDSLVDAINNIIAKINNILKNANSSNLMRNGIKVVIAGKPNVGKSSIFNALLNIDRAIVTNIPGTTRDIIQEFIDINGIPVTLTDTAGIRELENTHSSDFIESIGINITKSYIKDADIAIFVYDLTQGMLDEDKIIYDEIKEKPLIKVASKCDLTNHDSIDDDTIPVSAKSQIGLDKIKQSIEKLILNNNFNSETEFATNLRQQECLTKAQEALHHALNSSIQEEVQDFIAIDLKSAVLALGEITGEVVSDEIINNIFSSFCIGK